MRKLGRMIAAALLAVGLALVAQSIGIPICDYLTPGSYWYEKFCSSGSAGGGESGAGLP